MVLKLIEHVVITRKLITKTGMRIGGTKSDIEIGGLDNPIIRDSPNLRELFRVNRLSLLTRENLKIGW